LCDVEGNRPLEEDTVFRIYSMTKPITSVGLMMMYEQGVFQLDDPVSMYMPEFKDMSVFKGGNADNFTVTPAEREITIRHLLTHTSGLTYGFMQKHPVDEIYRRHDVGGATANRTTQSFVKKLGELPLLFSPGDRWSYSVATDVLGRLIEILSGQTLDAYFDHHILTPLGMAETAFSVPDGCQDRFAANYRRSGNSFELIDDPKASAYLAPPALLSGGGGLVSTTGDYYRFCQMLLNRGELDGVRLLGSKTVDFMRSNHLPNGGDLTSMGQAVFSETQFDGVGFGLGFSVMLDPVRAQVLGSPGEYAWGGAASTGFWIDPVEDLIGIFMTQLMPSAAYAIRRELRVLVYQSIVD
jgi:CubicO group peptidase (beta-lactamase class C family)